MEEGRKDPGFPSMYYFSIDSPYLLKFLLFYVNYMFIDKARNSDLAVRTCFYSLIDHAPEEVSVTSRVKSSIVSLFNRQSNVWNMLSMYLIFEALYQLLNIFSACSECS
jgi:hypothetical protein